MEVNIMEERTLGQMIGKVNHTLSITNDKGEQTTISVLFDFTTSTNQDIKSWLCGNRTIAFQRPTRSLSVKEIEALNGTTIIAQNAGQKIKSKEEKVSQLVSAGLPRKLAEFAVDNPDKFNSVVDSIVGGTTD
jgi:hypothetical protein